MYRIKTELYECWWLSAPIIIRQIYRKLFLQWFECCTRSIMQINTSTTSGLSLKTVVCTCWLLKLPSHIPRDLTASLLRPCYDPGRSTVAMDAAGTQRGRSEEPKDAHGRRPSANILNMHKTVADTLHSCWVLVRSRWDRSRVAIVEAAS